MKVVSLSCEIRRGWYLHPMLSTCIRYPKLRSGQPYHEDSEARRSEASQKFDEARRGEARFLEGRTRRGETIWKLVEAKRSDLAKTCLVSGSGSCTINHQIEVRNTQIHSRYYHRLLLQENIIYKHLITQSRVK